MSESSAAGAPAQAQGGQASAAPRSPMGALLVAGTLLIFSGGVVPVPAWMRVLVPLAAFVLIDGFAWRGVVPVVLGLGAGVLWLLQQGDAVSAVLLLTYGLGGIAAAVVAGRGFGPFVGGLSGAAPVGLVSVTLFLGNLLGFQDKVRDALLDAVAWSKTAGYVPPQLSNALPTVQDLWMRFYPMMLIVSVLATATAVFLLAEVLIPLIGRPALRDGRFRFWRMPDGMVWVLIGGLALLLIRQEPFAKVGENLTAIMVAAYGGVGLSIVRYFLLAWGLPTAVQVFITGALFLLGVVSEMPLVPAFAIALGFLDTWMDFRGLQTPRMQAGEERPTQ